MRFVIVDLEGASRDYFSERQDLVEALEELERDDAGITEELFVVAIDEEGRRMPAPERGDEVLAGYQTGAKTYLRESPQRDSHASAAADVIRDRQLVGAGRSPAMGSA